MSHLRGKLIVFEGLDRAGKSTQCEWVAKTLRERGHNCRHVRFPDRTTPIGKMINDYLRGTSEQEDHVIHLLFSANRWELAASIRADIEAGTTVIVDRYYYSGCVYSAAKNNPSLSLAWSRHPEVGLPRPDLCLFLDISAAKAAERGGYGEERYENKQMQDRVRELFGELQAAPEKDDFVKVDGGQSLEKVQDTVLSSVLGVFQKVNAELTPLRTVEAW
ncbi:thymidylate kinase [Aulographum hederae CBS 113979]|uniref:Thymidylate kinase n=1 Tax=Aulographum hederae CBS 113979 TaxID=1176131 RepID=A0A6G1HDL8_9PEZI|nr:thymidylate kinase [Aulographum hederae CBS 113979]